MFLATLAVVFAQRALRETIQRTIAIIAAAIARPVLMIPVWNVILVFILKIICVLHARLNVMIV